MNGKIGRVDVSEPTSISSGIAVRYALAVFELAQNQDQLDKLESDIKNFKVPETINFFPINYDTGKMTGFDNPKSVIEAFKEENFSDIALKNLNLRKKRGKFDIFTRFY